MQDDAEELALYWPSTLGGQGLTGNSVTCYMFSSPLTCLFFGLGSYMYVVSCSINGV